MKIIILKILTVLFFCTFIFSCKKKNNSPEIAISKCPLLAINGPTGNIRNFEWVGNKLIRVFNKDSIPTTIVFRYNTKNLAETMEISAENTSEKYFVKFIYGENNIIVKSNVTVNGIQFMTNNFSYNEKNTLTSIKTTVDLFGRKSIGKTRIEYLNNNVSKVYSSIDNDLEKLSFTGDVYDDKAQYFPDIYKTAAVGFVGIANNFFSYFGKNNMIIGKIYDGQGRLNQETKIEYEYNKVGLPVKSETVSLRNGKKFIEVCSYNFGCK